MNSWMYVIVLRTIPKIDASRYENNQITLKPKKEYFSDFIYSMIFTLICIVCFFLTSVPYLGVFFFIIGTVGTLYCLLLSFRNAFIYRNYEQIFSEENIKKLIK